MKIDKKREFLLQETSNAFNASVCLKYMQKVVRDYRIKKNKEIGQERKHYLDSNVEKLSEYIYSFAPDTLFWRICLEKIFNDMDEYKFSEQPSINRYQSASSRFFMDDKIERKMICCEQTSLSKHTLDLIETYFKSFVNSASYKRLPTFEILMSCLLHDFGKSVILAEKECGINDIKSISHEIISGRYIYRLMEYTKQNYLSSRNELDESFYVCLDQLSSVRFAVVSHHDSNYEECSLTDALKTIDAETRIREFAKFERNQLITNGGKRA